jgi:hypothetical protein
MAGVETDTVAESSKRESVPSDSKTRTRYDPGDSPVIVPEYSTTALMGAQTTSESDVDR